MPERGSLLPPLVIRESAPGAPVGAIKYRTASPKVPPLALRTCIATLGISSAAPIYEYVIYAPIGSLYYSPYGSLVSTDP